MEQNVNHRIIKMFVKTFVVATSVAKNKRLKSSLRTIITIILLDFALPYSYYSYAQAQQLETRNPKLETETGTEGAWKTYRYVDGLANNIVDAIIQDKEGVMWCGTREGVSRFDGKSWKTYTQKDGLVHNRVVAIMQDKEGTIWFGTNDGVSRFDGKSWKTYTQKDGLADNRVGAIMEDKEGIVWFGTESGISRFDEKSWKTYTQKDGLASNWVMAIMQDKEGAIWFGTVGGISRFDGKSWKIYTQKDRLASNDVNDIMQDKEGTIWVGTWSGGVSRFDEKSWKTYTQKEGLAGNSVRAITEDKEGAFWFGTNGGVSRFDGRSWKTYTQGDGFDTTQPKGLASNRVAAIMQDKEGTIWVGTNGGGVSRFDGKSWKTYTQKDGLARNNVSDIIQDREGAIWFGTNGGGVSRFDGRSWTTYTQKDGLANNRVAAIMQDKEGVIWFGTYGSGVSRFDGKNWKTYTQKDGLAANRIRAIMQDKEGAIWFGAHGAVSRFDGRNWKTYTHKDGLVGNRVSSIIQDKEGTIWVGMSSQAGVNRFDGKCFQNIDSRDGLVSDAVNRIYMDRSGQIWIGTEGGAVRFMPPSKISLTANITQVLADETRHETQVSGLRSQVPSLKLTSDVRRVVFSFHSISFKTRPGGMKYFYQLIGPVETTRRVVSTFINSNWQGPTNEESIEYFNLKPGQYNFKVQAVDRDLNYSKPVSLQITIPSPPFYTRLGFIIGTILFALFSPIATYTGLTIRQRRKAKEIFEPIPNPYIVGNPIRSKEMFFGRESDFEFIKLKLATGETGLVIVFAGERRSGKTSILFQILNGRLGERFIPVLLDMQAMTIDSEAEFFEKITTEINEALVALVGLHDSVSPASPASPASFTASDRITFREGNPTRSFERFTSDVMKAIEGKSLLLLFDEYELLEAKIDEGVLRRDIITFLASLLDAQPRLSFIVTGSRHLEARNPQYWQTLIGKSLYRKISFLSERDAFRLITEPVKERLVYPKGIPERLYRLTAGQPFYTQVVCQNLVDRLNEAQRNRVRISDAESVAQDLAENPLPQMLYFWDGLKLEHRSLLSYLAEVLEASSGYASAELVLKFAKEHNLALELKESELERVMDELFVNEVLERERVGEGQYEYRFRVDLLRLWVRQAHSVWQVA